MHVAVIITGENTQGAPGDFTPVIQKRTLENEKRALEN